MLIERLTHKSWPLPPTDYSVGVAERWEAIKPLYVLMRNKETKPKGNERAN